MKQTDIIFSKEKKCASFSEEKDCKIKQKKGCTLSKPAKKKSPVKEIREQIRQAYRLTGKLKGRNNLERKYIAKMRYMLFFLGSGLVLCKKKLVENWEMPDARIVDEVTEKGGRL